MDEVRTRRELWADPPRVPTPKLLDDLARARRQKLNSDARRKQLIQLDTAED